MGLLALVGQQLATVTYVPSASLRDWRIASLYYLLLLGAVAYMVVELSFLHRYAEFAPARAFPNVWTASMRDAATARDGPRPSYCSNASYNWVLTPAEMRLVGPFSMVNVSCEWRDDGEVVIVGENVFGIATNVRITDSANASNSGFRLVEQVDAVSFNIQTRLYVGEDSRKSTLPAIYFHDAHGALDFGTGFARTTQTTPGGFISLPVPDILRLAGTSLEKLAQRESFGGFELPPLRQRMSGIDLALVLEFSNRRPWELGSSYQIDAHFEHQENNWGLMGSVKSGAQSIERYGIRVTLVLRGTIGTANPYRVIVHLTNSVVLLQVVRALVVLLLKVLHPTEAVVVAPGQSLQQRCRDVDASVGNPLGREAAATSPGDSAPTGQDAAVVPRTSQPPIGSWVGE